jgi:hypothetical protein
MDTAEFFAERRPRADFAGFDRLMWHKRGEAPASNDTIASPMSRTDPRAYSSGPRRCLARWQALDGTAKCGVAAPLTKVNRPADAARPQILDFHPQGRGDLRQVVVIVANGARSRRSRKAVVYPSRPSSTTGRRTASRRPRSDLGGGDDRLKRTSAGPSRRDHDDAGRCTGRPGTPRHHGQAMLMPSEVRCQAQKN